MSYSPNHRQRKNKLLFAPTYVTPLCKGDQMRTTSVASQLIAIEQYFPVALFIMLYKVALTFETEDPSLRKQMTFYGDTTEHPVAARGVVCFLRLTTQNH